MLLLGCDLRVKSHGSMHRPLFTVGHLCTMQERTTMVLGASPHPDRYSHLAVQRLVKYAMPVIAVGNRVGWIGEVPILKKVPDDAVIDTVTLYLSPMNHAHWRERILALAPRRIIFNPGTEHPGFEAMAKAEGIDVVRGCTLVMLSVGTY